MNGSLPRFPAKAAASSALCSIYSSTATTIQLISIAPRFSQPINLNEQCLIAPLSGHTLEHTRVIATPSAFTVVLIHLALGPQRTTQLPFSSALLRPRLGDTRGDMATTSSCIYHLVEEAKWKEVGAEGYLPPTYAADGFIHATAEAGLLIPVANLFYTGRCSSR